MPKMWRVGAQGIALRELLQQHIPLSDTCNIMISALDCKVVLQALALLQKQTDTKASLQLPVLRSALRCRHLALV